MSFEIMSDTECRALETRDEGRKMVNGTVQYKKTKIVGTRDGKKVFRGGMFSAVHSTPTCVRWTDGKTNG